MKKMRLTTLLLAAILSVSCVAPAVTYAAEVEDQPTTEVTEQSTEKQRAPYMLYTEQVDLYDANKVRVWMDLDPAKAESIASYQIKLMVQDGEGSIDPSRDVTIELDPALEDAQIKETSFDKDTQTMSIYVASNKNLVQFEKDAKGKFINKLPIGVISVPKKAEGNAFKIVLSDKTGDFTTVGLNMQTNDVSETYGAEFTIPVDGVVYGGPVELPLGIKIEGKGTVTAYVVDSEGNETKATDKVQEGDSVRLAAIPAQGYRLTELVLTDSLNNDTEVALSGDFKFTMSSVIGVKAKFEVVEDKYSVEVVGQGASILGMKEQKAEFKAREVATVLAKASADQKFSHWKNELTGDVVSYKSNYSFSVTSSIKLSPVFVKNTDPVQVEPTVMLNTPGTMAPFSGKYRLSYSGTFSLPGDCKLVQRGVVLTNQAIDESNVENFVKDGTINGVKVATCAVSGTSAQFIINVNNVKAGGQSRTARAFLTYLDGNGETQTVYSQNWVELVTP